MGSRYLGRPVGSSRWEVQVPGHSVWEGEGGGGKGEEGEEGRVG